MQITNESHRQRALDWQRANQTILAAAVAEVRAELESFLVRQSKSGTEPLPPAPTLSLVDGSGRPLSSTLDSLCRMFELTPLERKIVLLCLGMETDSGFARLCARVHGNDEMAYPTVCLALRVFEGADWSVCSPHGALRKWEIIELGQGRGRVFQPIALSERILDYLLDHAGLDQRLLGIVQPLNEPVSGADLDPEERARVQDVVDQVVKSAAVEAGPVTQLCGSDPAQNRKLAQVAATVLGCELFAISLEHLPREPMLLERVVRLWEREAMLTQSMLLLEAFTSSRPGHVASPPMSWVLDRLRCPVLVSSATPQAGRLRRLHTVQVPDRRGQRNAGWWLSATADQELSDDGAPDDGYTTLLQAGL
jgi:hypothetical protein